MRVHPRTIKSTKQVSFWLGKLNFWTNIVANPKTKCLSAILGHVESANCCIISSRLSFRIKRVLILTLLYIFITLVLTTTLLIALLPGVTAPPSSVMSQFVCSFHRLLSGVWENYCVIVAGKLVKWELNFAQESRNCVVVRSRGADRVCRLSIDHRNFTRIDGDWLFTCRTEYGILKYGGTCQEIYFQGSEELNAKWNWLYDR